MSRSGDMADRPVERTPFGWAALAAALAVCAGPVALAQTPPAPVAPNSGGAAVLLEADQLIDDQLGRTVTAEGDVQVRYEGRTLRADRLVYDLSTGAIRAIGNVEIVLEDGSTTYAEEIEADEALNVGAASELRARLGESGTLAARSALRHGEGESELRNVIYTSCPICENSERPPTWSLRARRAVQDHESRTISYQGAVIEVAGVPLLYFPYFAHPDPTVGRASGFLTPDVGRNRRLGTFYEQPYYWAISPSQDLTTSLRLHGNVNPLIGVEYRKRFWSGEVLLDTTFTQEEVFDSDGNRLGDERFRYSAFAEGRFELNNYWDWGFGVEHIYDDEYLRRYDIRGPGERRGPYVGQDTRLISQLFAIGQDARSYTSVAFVDFQGLRETDSADLLPVILPFAETERVFRDPVLGGQVRLQANTALLSRDDNPVTLAFEGSDARLSLGATWRKDAVFGPGMVFSPFAQARGDLFYVETTPDQSESFSRGLGLAGRSAGPSCVQASVSTSLSNPWLWAPTPPKTPTTRVSSTKTAWRSSLMIPTCFAPTARQIMTSGSRVDASALACAPPRARIAGRAHRSCLDAAGARTRLSDSPSKITSTAKQLIGSPPSRPTWGAISEPRPASAWMTKPSKYAVLTSAFGRPPGGFP